MLFGITLFKLDIAQVYSVIKSLLYMLVNTASWLYWN